MLVEREVTDTNLNIMDYISQYIDAFNRYEEILSGNEMYCGNESEDLTGEFAPNKVYKNIHNGQ